METGRDFIFLGAKITADEIKRHLFLGRKAVPNLDSILKSRDIKSPASHVWMWELDHKESWAPKNWCFWSMVLEKTLQSPLDCKEIQHVHPKGNQSWIFIEGLMLKLILQWKRPWCSNGKDPDAGKDWKQEEKGMTEDEMVGWHHPLDGHEFEQVLWVGDGQGGLVCYSPWGYKESEMTEWLS